MPARWNARAGLFLNDQPMTNYEPEPEETRGCTDLQITVCRNGVVNVHRPESDRAHSVFVGPDGDVLRCSCRSHRYHGHCTHADEIAARPLITASAQAAASGPRVATDGGLLSDETDDAETDERPDDCRCAQYSDMVCPPCSIAGFETQAGVADIQESGRTKRANFGGGESTGVVEL